MKDTLVSSLLRLDRLKLIDLEFVLMVCNRLNVLTRELCLKLSEPGSLLGDERPSPKLILMIKEVERKRKRGSCWMGRGEDRCLKCFGPPSASP